MGFADNCKTKALAAGPKAQILVLSASSLSWEQSKDMPWDALYRPVGFGLLGHASRKKGGLCHQEAPEGFYSCSMSNASCCPICIKCTGAQTWGRGTGTKAVGDIWNYGWRHLQTAVNAIQLVCDGICGPRFVLRRYSASWKWDRHQGSQASTKRKALSDWVPYGQGTRHWGTRAQIRIRAQLDFSDTGTNGSRTLTPRTKSDAMSVYDVQPSDMTTTRISCGMRTPNLGL